VCVGGGAPLNLLEFWKGGKLFVVCLSEMLKRVEDKGQVSPGMHLPALLAKGQKEG
jgi:hypothetical protein